MTPESKRASESASGGEPDLGGKALQDTRPTRRGVLLGVSLAGLGGALAGCSTAAVPYDANEAGAVDQAGAAAQAATPAAGAMAGSGAMSSPGAMPSTGPASPGPASPAQASPAPDKPEKEAKLTGIVLGAASEIPVGGGKIYTAARVVVTQPARGQYNAFSAVCTHVGCIMSEVANGTIDCPCHGSEFKITTGAVVTGPAPAPLPKKQIKIVDGQVVLL
jgi:Rieske Fe-S protein